MKRFVILLLVLGLVTFGCVTSTEQPIEEEWAESTSDVKLEFIPQDIETTCSASALESKCTISFQVKNVGSKKIRVLGGDFEDTRANQNFVILSTGSSTTLNPGEISQTLMVNIMGQNEDEQPTASKQPGIYNVKIPFQVYAPSGHRIGESDYYLIVKLTVEE